MISASASTTAEAIAFLSALMRLRTELSSLRSQISQSSRECRSAKSSGANPAPRLSSGLSLTIVGRLLGHTNPTTTQRYAHLADAPLREAAEVMARKMGQIDQNR
ncbi:hypothetical protein [Amaricoccus sp. W119]|uniref:hypothetical protein n=1 Tax=Amaricoccus sp. W119 TaxID=3391833 RepID=UPI0039A4D887